MDLDENEFSLCLRNDIPTYRCKVCDDKGARLYYGGVCCSPCRMFFRRNCQFDLTNRQCTLDGQCDVTMDRRRACRYCRLKSCFSAGLQKKLVRNTFAELYPSLSKNLKKNTRHNIFSTHKSFDNHQLLLTVKQWSIFSNIIDNYDNISSISNINKYISLQSTYPIKMRFKMGTIDFQNIISLWYINIIQFLNKLPEFKSLSLNDQCILIQRNIEMVSNLGGIIILRDTRIYDNIYFYNSLVANYGLTITNKAINIINKSDINGLLIKLCLPLMFFSTCSKYVNPNRFNEIDILSNSKRLFEIQNIYIELLFKYMLYQFNYKETIMRFFGLIKTFLDLINLTSNCDELQKYDNLIQRIIEQTKQILILKTENIELKSNEKELEIRIDNQNIFYE